MTNSSINNGLQKGVGNVLTQSLEVYKEILKLGLQNTNFKFPASQCDNCPPKDTCPPKFIGEIHRTAMTNERIVIPFIIKNDCSQMKNYQVGIRELKNQDGSLAPNQPQLNKNYVSLSPNGEERILVEVDLANFKNGIYLAEIVVREKEYNQNILLTLTVADYPAPVFRPLDEKKYKLKWQSWKTHFYCEPKRKTHENGTHGN